MTPRKRKLTLKRRRKRPLLVRIALITAGLFLFLSLTGVIFLRTSLATEIIFNQTAKILAADGYTLAAAEISGPLPGHLRAQKIHFADDKGLVVRAAEVEVELNIWALFTGVVSAPLVKIDGPELVSLPLPKEDDDDKPFSLPVGISIGQLVVENGEISPNALANIGLLGTPSLAVNAEGSAQITTSLAANFQGQVKSAGHEILLIKLALDSAADLTEQLTLELKIDDPPAGILAATVNNDKWSGLRAKFNGKGPLKNWNGNWELDAGLWGHSTGQLNFKGQRGRLLSDLWLEPSWQGEVVTQNRPGPAAPKSWRKWLGSEGTLRTTGVCQGDKITAQLELLARATPKLKLSGQLVGSLMSGAENLQFTASLTGLLGPGGEPELTAAANLSGTPQGQDLSLSLSGDGLNLAARLKQNYAADETTGTLRLSTSAASPWTAESWRLAGAEPQILEGALDLDADFKWHGAAQDVKSSLKFSAQEMAWGNQQLESLLGSEFSFNLEANGGGEYPLAVELKNFQTPNLGLDGHFLWQEALGQIETKLSAHLLDLSIFNPQYGGPLSLEIAANGPLDNLEGELALKSPTLKTEAGIFKDTALTVKAQGALVAPTDSGSTAGFTPNLNGELSLVVAESPGGLANLTGKWEYSQKDKALTLRLKDLIGTLAGLSLGGNLSLATQESTPVIIGNLLIDVNDWAPLAALSGQKINGEPLKLQLEFTAPEKRQSLHGLVDIPRLKIADDLSLQQLKLDFQVADFFARPDLNWNFTAASGTVGSTSWGKAQITAQGEKGLGNFTAEIGRLKLAGVGGGPNDSFGAKGSYDVARLLEPDYLASLNLQSLNFRLGGSGLRLAQAVKIHWGDSLKVEPVVATVLPKGSLKAEINLAPDSLKIWAEAQNVPYALAKPFVPNMPNGVIEKLTVDLAQKSQNGPSGNFSLLTNVEVKEGFRLKPILTVNGKLTAGANPHLEMVGEIKGGRWPAKGDFTAKLPLAAQAGGGFPTVDMVAPVAAALKFTGPVAPIWNIFGPADRTLTGVAQVNLRVNGPLNQPQAQGDFYFSGGRFEDQLLGLLIDNIQLSAQSTPEMPLKAILQAGDGKGGLLGLDISLGDLASPQILAKGELSRFSPLYRDDVDVAISGTFGAAGPITGLKLTSDLAITSGDIDLTVAAAGQSITTLDLSQGSKTSRAAAPIDPQLDLRLKIPKQFFIEGFGLKSEWEGDLNITGSAMRPSIKGSVSPVRGYLELFGKDFELSDGDIAFYGGTNPNLNLELTHQGDNIIALVRIAGSAKTPSLKLESRPPLPEEEILGQVLFDKSASDISQFEAIQLANVVQELANIGQGSALSLVSNLRKTVGLDVLRFGGKGGADRERDVSNLSGSIAQGLNNSSPVGSSGEEDEFAVEAGKYISDNIYVGVEHSAAEGAAVRVEVELSPMFDFEARTSSESSQVGIGWKKDY